ncbi:RBR-type E3 ubiquitin transferase [Sarracenia purpurea var. burkii]
MSTNGVSPAEIENVADDEDDDIAVLCTPPILRNNSGSNANNAISVEQYSDDRDLQLAIMASLLRQTRRKGNKRRIIDLSHFPDPGDEVEVLKLSPSPSRSSSFFRNSSKGISIIERGQSSNSNSDAVTTFVCEICVDQKPSSGSLRIMGCSHSYCSECMIKYVASKLQENITQVRCPASDCNGILEPEYCRSILPPEVFDRWGNALCEAVILAAEKIYCPFKDCSALLINDGGGGPIITQTECPYCWRLFCAQCKVPWHSEILCEDFQALNKDEREREDILLVQLAKKQGWRRCPVCKFIVERSQGCLYMRCSCARRPSTLAVRACLRRSALARPRFSFDSRMFLFSASFRGLRPFLLRFLFGFSLSSLLDRHRPALSLPSLSVESPEPTYYAILRNTSDTILWSMYRN